MSRVEIRLLGSIEALRDGARIELPRSRKTRALLAYLAATGAPQGRERLCSMFWETPDDPRGALRWSLSKLRALLDDPGTPRFLGDRDAVALDLGATAVDVVDVARSLDQGASGVAIDELERLAARFRGDFLTGLDLPRCPEFHVWCLAERERHRAAHATILGDLVERLTDDPGRALAHASALVRLDPADETGHVAFVRLLSRLGRRDDARRQADIARQLLSSHGIAATAALDHAWREPSLAAKPRPEALSSARSEAVALDTGQPAPPDSAIGRPTVALLPFEDLGSEPGRSYFADGVTQDIATNLARFRSLLVIATQSSFNLRDRSNLIASAGAELGATYVLDGSIRRSEERIRIVANLHDAHTGTCLWSERYDRDLEDVFAIQDDVARRIAASLAGHVATLSSNRARQKRPESMVAYDYFLRGLEQLGRYRLEDLRFAEAMFHQALRLDAAYAAPMFGLAQVAINRWFLDADETALDDAYGWARRALDLDPDDAWCNMIAGRVLLHRRDFERGRYYYERAVDLNPSCADILASYSYLLTCLGRPREAVRMACDAMRLNPRHSPWYDENLGNALFANGEYDEALRAFLRVPNAPAYVHGYMAACLARLGRLDEARAEAARSVAMDPTQSIQRHRRGEPYLRPEDMDDLLDALREAGLPETHEAEAAGISARARQRHGT